VIIVIFSIGFLVRGSILYGIGGIVAAIYIYFWTRDSGSPIEINPLTRIMKFGMDPNSINLSFDNIASFDVITQKQSGNFTEEKIMVVVNDGQGIHIGTITDANQQNRAEKVSRMINFLYDTTGVVRTFTEPD
jgi:hypothetical protein